MSTQAVSNVSILQELQSFNQARRTDLQQLGAALQTGGNQNTSSQQSPAFLVSLISIQNTSNTGHAGGTESINQQTQDFRQQRKAGLEQLRQALQSGNADAAQQAYDALVTLGQNGPLRNGQTFHRADRAQDFAAIGQALASGDLAGARASFFALASTFGNHAGGGVGSLPPGPPTLIPPDTPPPGPPTLIPPSTTGSHHGTVPPGPPTLIPPLPSTVGGGPSGPPEIIINVGGSTAPNGSATEIAVNLPKPSGTSEEVQINFGGSQDSAGKLTIDVNQQHGSEEVAISFNRGNTNYQLALNLLEPASTNAAQNNAVSLQA